LVDAGNTRWDALDTLLFRARRECVVQRRTPDTTTWTAAEVCFRPATVADVGDPAQRQAGWVHAQRCQLGQAAGHQAFTAGFVDRVCSRLGDDYRKTLPARV
jgi:hypothetical protein